MDKHAPKEEMIKDLENILAKINALEVSARAVSYTHLTLPTTPYV